MSHEIMTRPEAHSEGVPAHVGGHRVREGLGLCAPYAGRADLESRGPRRVEEALEEGRGLVHESEATEPGIPLKG